MSLGNSLSLRCPWKLPFLHPSQLQSNSSFAYQGPIPWAPFQPGPFSSISTHYIPINFFLRPNFIGPLTHSQPTPCFYFLFENLSNLHNFENFISNIWLIHDKTSKYLSLTCLTYVLHVVLFIPTVYTSLCSS